MKEPRCILSYPAEKQGTVACCLMLIVNITEKPFLVSLRLDDWENSSRKSLWDGTANLQYFCSCRQAEKVWVQGAVSRTSRAEIFGNAACSFPSRESALLRVDAGLGHSSWSGAGPRSREYLNWFPHVWQLWPPPTSLPCAPVTGSRSKTVPGREAEVRRKGVGVGVLQGLGRKLGLATSRAL